MTTVIGFGYQSRSGKDTAAAIILKERAMPLFGMSIKRYSFAQELKREVNVAAMQCGGMRQLIGGDPSLFMTASGNFLELPDWVQYDPNPPMDDPDCPLGKQRTFLQWYGTEYRRGENPSYWLDKVAKRIEEEKPEVALITDLRMPNEFSYIQQHGFTVRIDRPGNISEGRVSHESEVALSRIPDELWSAVILNDGDLDDLQWKVLLVFDSLLERRGAGVPDGTAPTSAP